MTSYMNPDQGLDLGELDFELTRKALQINNNNATEGSPSRSYPSYQHDDIISTTGIEPPPNSFTSSFINSGFRYQNIPTKKTEGIDIHGWEAPPNTPLTTGILFGSTTSHTSRSSNIAGSILNNRLNTLNGLTSIIGERSALANSLKQKDNIISNAENTSLNTKHHNSEDTAHEESHVFDLE